MSSDDNKPFDPFELTAAILLGIGAIIVTNNVKDFGRVKGLQVENWAR